MSPFIVIESLDAAGGTTQTSRLVNRLKKEQYRPHQYHFPQEDKATGRIIYEKYLHDKGKHPLTGREQSLLYIQDFYSRLEEMEHALKEKHAVIVSDRYCTSTLVYQTIDLTGKKRADMLEWIQWLCWEGTPALLKPSIVFLLDIPTDRALERLQGKKRDLHERKDMMEKVRKNYTAMAHEMEWTIIDAVDKKGNERSRKEIHEEIWSHTRLCFGFCA